MSTQRSPRSAVVVGAGMVGLSTAWFLAEHGIEVDVVDSGTVCAGSSWGNAGWLTPGLAAPLPEPGVLKYGMRAVLSPSSPVYVPPTLDRNLLRFVKDFTRNCTTAKWRAAFESLSLLNRGSLEAFEELERGGIEARTSGDSTLVAGFRDEGERHHMLEELQHVDEVQSLSYDVLDGDQVRAAEPLLSSSVTCGVSIHGQRYIDPGAYVGAIATALRARGGRVHEHRNVTGVTESNGQVVVSTSGGGEIAADTAVIATGTWLSALARDIGVRTTVQAGRGYSFTVDAAQAPQGPIYLPTQRVACVPYQGRLRVVGMMEFRKPDAPLDRRRVSAIADAAGPLLDIDVSSRTDEWVGSRPVTPDGLPLIGRTRSSRIHVAGGHGMWGITLGPVTGRLLAEQIATGIRPSELEPFDPLR